MRAPSFFAPAFLAGTLVWASSLLAAPYWAIHQPQTGEFGVSIRAAAAIYLMGGVICHQRPERSFHLWGAQLPVCARCSGLYAAAPIGAALGLVGGARGIRRRRRAQASALSASRAMLFVAAAPTMVAVLAEGFGLAHPSSLTRAVTAAPLGASVAWLAAAASRNIC